MGQSCALLCLFLEMRDGVAQAARRRFRLRGEYFWLSFEPTFDADRSDWQIAKRGVVDPFDSEIPGRNMRGRQSLFRFVTRRNTVEVALCMASTPTASTLQPIYISDTFSRRLGFFF